MIDGVLKDFREQRGTEVDSAGVIHKAFSAPASWNAEKRTVRFVMASEEPDRMKDVVRINGLNLKTFRANPVALMFHSSRDFPIGKWTDVKRSHDDKGTPILEGTLQLLPEGVSGIADTAAKMLEHGVIRAVSVGFLPKKLKWREDKDADGERIYGFDIQESELLECSLVNVPAQQAAMAKDAMPEGLTSEMIDWVARNFTVREDIVVHRSLVGAESPKPPDTTSKPEPTDVETKKFVVDPAKEVELQDQEGNVLWKGTAGELTNDSAIRAAGLSMAQLEDPEGMSEESKGAFRRFFEGIFPSLKSAEPTKPELEVKPTLSGQLAYVELSQRITRGKAKLRETQGLS